MAIERARRCRALTFMVVAGALLIGGARRGFAFSDKKPFDIAADAIDFIDDTKEMVAEGHVVVIQGSSTLKADYLHFDRLNHRLLGHGNVILRENGGILTGDSLDYNMETETANLQSPKAYAAPWFFQGGTWEKHEDYYVGKDGSFTSCELPDAHYFFRAKRIHYVPNDRFWAWSTRMYVDGVPVFYMPFVQKPLGPQKVTFQAQPGDSSAEGAFAKTVTTLRYTDKVYQKVFADFYSDVGNGYGTELDYNPSRSLKGSFFGYYIKPFAAPDVQGAPSDAQYNVRSYHWQQLKPEWTLQSNVNWRNNVSFNNLFYQQDPNQAVSEVLNSVALTQQSKKYNQHIVFQVDQEPDPGTDPLFAKTHIQSASLPAYTFTLYQMPLWQKKHLATTATGYMLGPLREGVTTYSLYHAPLQKPDRIGPLNFSATAGANEDYSRIDHLTRTKLNAQGALSQSYTLTRDLTLTPSINAQSRWQDLDDPSAAAILAQQLLTSTGAVNSTLPIAVPVTLRRGEQGLGGTSTNLRYRVTRDITLDQTYQLTYRTAPNAFILDRSQPDGGIDTHHISWVMVDRPSQAVLVRSFSGYDFRRLEYEDLYAYRQRRVDPWTTQVTVSPSRSPYELNLSYSMGYFPTRDISWEVSGKWTAIHKTVITSGFLYNRGLPGQITWNNTLGFYVSPGWRLDAQIDSYIPSLESVAPLGQVGKIIDDEFIVTRDIHCWSVQFIFRNRPPIDRSYAVLASLKFGPQTPKKIEDTELESQFYPWRSGAWAY